MNELKVYKPKTNLIITLIYPLLFIIFIVLYLLANPITAHAAELDSNIVITQTGSQIIKNKDNGNITNEYHYDFQYTYHISKYDYVFVIDDTYESLGIVVPVSHLYYYNNGKLIEYTGTVNCDYTEITTGTQNTNNHGTAQRNISFTNSYSVIRDYTADYTESITMNYVTNALVFGTKESAIAYFETGDTSGQVNKTIDMSTATYNSNIPAPKLVFNSKGGYKFSIDNAVDGYYIQMKGRWYTVDDITLYKENLQWKYKYDTLLKGTLTEWVKPNDKILATAEHDLCDYNRKGYGGEAFTALIAQYDIEQRKYSGGTNSLGDKITGYTDALSNLKELHLNNPESAFNSPEIYIRFIVVNNDNSVQYGKWCHWYSNLANASGSTGYMLGDSDNVAGESQSFNGLTDEELNSNEQQENPRNDSDIYTYVNSDYINQNLEISSEIANKTGTFFGLLNSMTNAMGQFPQMFKDVFMFLPPWFVEFIVIAMGAIIIARFIGR